MDQHLVETMTLPLSFEEIVVVKNARNDADF